MTEWGNDGERPSQQVWPGAMESAGAGVPAPVPVPLYSTGQPGQSGPGSMAPGAGVLGKDRSPGAVFGLSVITLGLYYLAWYGMLNGEIRRHDPDIRVSPGLSVLAAMVPFVNIVSAYSTAARIRQMQLDDGQTDTISPVVALLLFLFLGIGYPLYIASQVREHWHGHRRSTRASSG